MEVVLRPANDRFLREVAFPGFQEGFVAAEPALQRWLTLLDDAELERTLEFLLDAGAPTFVDLRDEHWHRVLYAVLFHDWVEFQGCWRRGDAVVGYAGDWDETLHLALMLEANDYPYAEPEEARAYRQGFAARPREALGLSSLLCGWWDPRPSFSPAQVLTTTRRTFGGAGAQLKGADWSWRSMRQVNHWAALLPGALDRLLRREDQRLHPVEIPEKHEVLQYWLGRVESPPLLAVTFSGLGPSGVSWLRELGRLSQLLRTLADRKQAVTAVLSETTGER